MKKELTGLFMTFAIIAMMLCGVVIYGHVNNTVYVKTPEALIEAIENVKDNETITLTDNIEIKEELNISTNMTLDLNGKTIKAPENTTGENSSLISVNDGAKLILAGEGVIESTTQAPAININGGTVEVNNGTIVGSGVYVEKGVATISGGTFKTSTQARNICYPIYASETNLQNGSASIEVKGGSFQNFDPAGSQFDNPIFNFMAEGFQSVYDEVTQYYNVEEIGVTLYASSAHVLEKAIAIAPENAKVVIQKDIELQRQLTLNKSLTLDLNGKSIFATQDLWNNEIKEWSMISVQNGADVTITGDGFITASNGENDECYGIDVREGGKLTFENGTVSGNCSALYVLEGEATIMDGTFTINDNNECYNYAYVLNCRDANLKSGIAKIKVAGGKYYKLNPANSRSENPLYNFVEEGYRSIYNPETEIYEVKPIVNVNVSTEQELIDAIANAKLDETIVLENDIFLQTNLNVSSTVVLNLNEKAIKATQDLWNGTTRQWSVISVQANGNLTITGNGQVVASTGEDDECYAIDVRDGGKLTIENGTFIGNCSAVYVLEGEALINGGTFTINDNNECYNYAYLINCKDANLKSGIAKITVTGGSFYKLNPANSRSENPLYNFVKKGYQSILDEESGFYNVTKKA